jgi:N-acyl-D-aspartate/D-glutamate deacylase
MHDIVIRGGTIIDGTGAGAVTGDVAIAGARLAEVGGKTGLGKREIDANGCWSPPGGLISIPIAMARRPGTRCSRPPRGMA